MSCARLLETEATPDPEHVRDCLACRAHLRELERLRRELRALAAPADELAARRSRAEVLARFVEVRPRRRWIAPALVIAAATAVVAVATRGRSPAPVVARDPIAIHADGARWTRLEAGATTIVRLDEGELHVHVDHGGAWHRLLVLVPDGEIDDLGTTFELAVANGHTTSIAVREGAVVFRARDRAARALVRGDRWVAPPAPPPQIVPAPIAAAPLAPPPTPHPRAPDPLAIAIELLDHHDPAGAARSLRALLARRHDEDAAYLLIIALQRIPDADAVRAAARAYLRDYPDGLRRASVEALAR